MLGTYFWKKAIQGTESQLVNVFCSLVRNGDNFVEINTTVEHIWNLELIIWI